MARPCLDWETADSRPDLFSENAARKWPCLAARTACSIGTSNWLYSPSAGAWCRKLPCGNTRKSPGCALWLAETSPFSLPGAWIQGVSREVRSRAGGEPAILAPRRLDLRRFPGVRSRAGGDSAILAPRGLDSSRFPRGAESGWRRLRHPRSAWPGFETFPGGAESRWRRPRHSRSAGSPNHDSFRKSMR